MSRYRYVILEFWNQLGKGRNAPCFAIEETRLEPASLDDLLRDGWRPVRETPCLAELRVLILLEKTDG